MGEGVSQRGKLLAAVNRVAKVRAQGEGEGDSSRKSICVVGFVLSCFRATFVVVLLPLPLPLPPLLVVMVNNYFGTINDCDVPCPPLPPSPLPNRLVLFVFPVEEE